MNGSVIKAINLLEELAKSKTPAALKDLARSVKLDKATAYRLLNSLREKGLVQKTGDHGSYGLGPKLLVLAEEYRKSFTMRDMVVPYLEQLVRATGETAIYCERFQYDSCVTIERRESPHRTRTVIETGVPRPLYMGSSAFAIFAMLPQEDILSILNTKTSKRSAPFTITLQKRILKKVEEARRRGYVVSIQERYSYTAGVGAPVFLDRNVIGSVAVIGPTERIKATGVEKIGRSVRRIADELSMELGCSKNLQSERSITKRLRMVK